MAAAEVVCDLVCDDGLEPFDARFGMIPLRAMALRNRSALARNSTR
jgi:hypothetical protein